MLLWKKSNLSVTPSARLFEDHIAHQMKHIVGGFVDKSKDHIERGHQDGRGSKHILWFDKFSKVSNITI